MIWFWTQCVDRERLVLVANADVELAKRIASALGQRGLLVSIVHDGVEAMLEIQRQLPRVAILSATLPRMYGFQICEVMKRNESLRSIPVVLAGSIHHTDRYRRESTELYGADAYLEDPDLPGGLIPILERIGVPVGPPVTPPSGSTPLAPPQPPPQPAPAPAASTEPAPRPAQASPPQTVPDPVTAPGPEAAPADDGLAEERAKAERLARIIVSDVILYNDPYGTGSHPQDAAMIVPVFLADTLVGYSVIKAHWLDIGGKDPYCTDTIDVFRLADAMVPRGWYIQPQLSFDGGPANIHLSVTPASVPLIDEMFVDIKACIEEIRGLEPSELAQSIPNMFANIDPSTINSEVLGQMTQMAGISSEELPGEMAEINQILDGLPDLVNEQLLIEFVNDLFKQPK